MIMVDFSKLLRNHTSTIKPRTEKVRGIRTNAFTNEVTDVDCEILVEDNSTLGPVVKLIGGPTGYESFCLNNVNLARLNEGWNACLGTKGQWDGLFIHGKSLIEAINKLKTCIK